MAVPTVVGVGALAAVTTGGCTPVAPAHIADDILLMYAEHSCTSNNITPVIAGGSAFALAVASLGITTTGGLACFWARATGPGMTIPAISEPGTTTQDHIDARIIVVRGCVKTGNPWEAIVATNVSGAGATTHPLSGLGAITTPNCLVIDAIGRPNDSAAANWSAWTNAGLTNLTEICDEGTTLGDGGGFGINTGELIAPATLSGTSATSAASTRWYGISMALKPYVAPAAGGAMFAMF